RSDQRRGGPGTREVEPRALQGAARCGVPRRAPAKRDGQDPQARAEDRRLRPRARARSTCDETRARRSARTLAHARAHARAALATRLAPADLPAPWRTHARTR